MNVSEAIGRALVEMGVRQVFGVVGSGNFHVTNALIASGANFVAARHECGAATMADAYSRMSEEVSVLTVHQGCGLTNAMTGIAEAAKSRSSTIVIAAEVTNEQSNFYVDQQALAESVGAISMRITTAETSVAEAREAYRIARDDRRTVVLNLPLPVQLLEIPGYVELDKASDATPERVPPSPEDLDRLVGALRQAKRPVFVAGRGARGAGCRDAIEALAHQSGALVATSAVAKGLFSTNPWSLDIAGGFSSPLAAELIREADLIVSWGCALNMWTTRHGRLLGPDATIIQVDLEATAIGAWQERAQGVIGDSLATAEAACAAFPQVASGYRTDRVAEQIARQIRWRDVDYEDDGTADRIDARTLSVVLDDLLPSDRILSIDSGNFMGYPSMFMSVPDEFGFCFTQAYQSIGLGLATAIGAALARPDRLPVAAVGDGGILMGTAELDTVVRLSLPMVIVVYNDDAYGAEIHHFGPHGHSLDTVEFPATDIAAIARGFGFEALTVRSAVDLEPVNAWVSGPRARPLLIDAKVTRQASWWLEEAFQGH